MFKKVVYVLLTMTLLIPCLFVPKEVIHAKTLGDLKRELQKQIDDYEANKDKQRLTEKEINQTKAEINRSNEEINQIGKDIFRLNEEIDQLNVSIEEKNKEIKDIMNFVQISNGESAYLEYAFGAQDFTDFIYRVAVSEQLANYNDKLIKEYNQNIIDNNKKTKELADKRVSLNNKQVELAANLKKLQLNKVQIEEYSLSIEDEIKNAKTLISFYQDQECKDFEDLSTCGTKTLPPDTAFYRPLVSGYVTSNYGWYDPYGTGQIFHYALDFSTSDNNTPVYASAAGKVALVLQNEKCGKNIVFIQHIINGRRYTTSYWHLRRVFVGKDDIVTKDTQIGIMGGAWFDNDECTNGPHVHFTVAHGLLGIDYLFIWEMNARRFDPREVLNAPLKGYYFANRYTKY